MIITGNEAVAKGYISYLLDSTSQIETVGVYLTLGKVSRFKDKGSIDFELANNIPVKKELIEFDGNYSIILEEGNYHIEFNEKIDLPTNVCGGFHTMPALIDSGVSVTCFLMTPEFDGNASAILQVVNPAGVVLAKHAKMGVCVFQRVDL